jgi:hypothetical protein
MRVAVGAAAFKREIGVLGADDEASPWRALPVFRRSRVVRLIDRQSAVGSGISMFESIVRAQGLDIHEVPDGYIIYQPDRDRVHYLNRTAAILLEFCDGELPAEDIVSRVASVYDLGPSAHDEIRAGLDSLKKEGLVQSPAK